MGFDQATHRPCENFSCFSNEYVGLKKNDTLAWNNFSENRDQETHDILAAQEVRDPEETKICSGFDVRVKFRSESEKENGLRTQTKNPRPTPLIVDECSPSMESSPYVLKSGATSPTATPSSGCKSPFVPSFKHVTKVFAFPSFIWAKVDAFIDRLNRWSKSADSVAEHFWAHMKLGGSVSETVLGKVSLATKIVTEGGVENLFKLSFSVGPREKLVKTSSCYLSTSSGPIAGLLFISTEKVAFCSDRPLSFTSHKKSCSYYRVAIPLGRAGSVNEYENMNKPAEKYIQIKTVDNHEFWFMGFVNYKKALKHLHKAVGSH